MNIMITYMHECRNTPTAAQTHTRAFVQTKQRVQARSFTHTHSLDCRFTPLSTHSLARHFTYSSIYPLPIQSHMHIRLPNIHMPLAHAANSRLYVPLQRLLHILMHRLHFLLLLFLLALLLLLLRILLFLRFLQHMLQNAHANPPERRRFRVLLTI